jgi:hypothetical protein
MKNNPNKYIHNFLREDVVYGELNDNMLIIGAGILCKVYMFEKLYNDYYHFFSWPYHDITNKTVFYTLAWKYYQEALQKYYPLFHHYN